MVLGNPCSLNIWSKKSYAAVPAVYRCASGVKLVYLLNRSPTTITTFLPHELSLSLSSSGWEWEVPAGGLLGGDFQNCSFDIHRTLGYIAWCLAAFQASKIPFWVLSMFFGYPYGMLMDCHGVVVESRAGNFSRSLSEYALCRKWIHSGSGTSLDLGSFAGIKISIAGVVNMKDIPFLVLLTTLVALCWLHSIP